MIDQSEHSDLVREQIEDYRNTHIFGMTPNDRLVIDGECLVQYGEQECRMRQRNGMCPHLIGQISCLPHIQEIR